MAKFWTSTQQPVALWVTDRKSTRLNSSHGYISYAVFCLKKKNLHIQRCEVNTTRGRTAMIQTIDRISSPNLHSVIQVCSVCRRLPHAVLGRELSTIHRTP